METGMTPADIAAVMRNDGCNGGGFGNGGFGNGGGALVLIILFALIFGNGGFGFGGRGNAVTEADLCSANSFSELKNDVGRLSDQLGNTYTGLQNGLCNLGYTNLENFNTTQRMIADCCCTTQRAVDSVKFDMANYTADINATTNAVGQKILDKLCEDKEARMAARIQQLELQAALGNVVRYPVSSTYFAGTNPFCNTNALGCGCGNI